MNGKINILIVHFNTPRLTECLVKSINKFTPNSNIYIFGNSDEFPFTAEQWIRKYAKYWPMARSSRK